MRVIIPLVLLVLLTSVIGVLADICTPSGDGYSRSYRPQGYTPTHGPINDPRCTPQQRDTNASSSALCWSCHPHQYQAWMRKYWRS